MGIGMKMLHVNNVIELLKAIPPEKMDLVITSPPFSFPPAERHDRRAAEGGRKRRGKDARKPRSARTAKGAG